MSVITSSAHGRAGLGRRFGLRVPVWMAVVCSRLIVLAAGAAGALFSKRVPGWAEFDPHRLSSSLGSVGNVLAASTFRWDGIRYVTIAEHGYTTASSTVSFPLYSLLIRVVGWLVISPVIAGVLISAIAFAVGLLLLHRLACEELGPRVADTAVLLLAFAPLSFFFTAVYTESLFMALSLGAFYLARRRQFAWASVAAACATLTHLEGVLLMAPIALIYWRDRGGTLAARRLWPWSATALLLPPLALAGFFLYLHAHGWSWLAPITNDNLRNYGRETMTTPVLLWRALDAGVTGLVQTLQGNRPIAPNLALPFSLGFQNLVYLIVLVISLAALVAVWRRLPGEYAVYATLVLIVCTWTGVAGRPLDAFDRYMLPIFPLWMGAAAWIQERRLTPAVLVLSTAMLIFYTVEFSRWVFIA